MPCKSSAGSPWQCLDSVGLFSDEKIESIVTLPAASMTANSEPVGLQQTCFRGPPSKFAVSGGVLVGSLKSQVPFSGLQRRFRNSKTAPSGVIDAMLPHFDHAMVLDVSVRALMKPTGTRHTGNSHSL